MKPRKKSDLTERQVFLLKAIAEEYVSTAQPVGSQRLVEKLGFQYSAATVRNDMGELEDSGYLSQPHTSAGRIPTQKTYRFCVDAIDDVGVPTLNEQESIQRGFDKIQREVDSALELAAKMLSWMSRSASLASMLTLEENHLRHVELIPLKDKTVLCILIFGRGYVHKKMVPVPENMSPSVLAALANVLNRHLAGRALSEIRVESLREIERDVASIVPPMKEVLLRVAREMMSPGTPAKIYFEGAQHVLSQPEFQSASMVQSLFAILEDESVLTRLLSETFSTVQGVKIIIGEENPYKEMDKYSLVLSPYFVGGKRVGAVGILGPTRMAYSKNIAVVKYLSEKLGEILSEKVVF